MSVSLAVGAGLLVLGATIALARIPLERLAYVTVGACVLSITWNGFRLAGGALSNAFLVLSVLAVFLHVLVDRPRVAIPQWLLAVAGLLIASWIAVIMFPPNLAVKNETLLQFGQLFTLAGVPIKALAPDRSNTSALVKWEIGLLMIPLMIVVVATTPERIRRLLDLWTISAVINAFVGLADYAGLHLAPTAIAGHRSSGLTIQPNYLALTCVLGIPTAARLIGRSRRETELGLLAVAILIGGEFASGSRDGNATAAIVLLLCVACLPRLRPALRYVLPLAAVGLVALLAFSDAGHTILNQVRLGGSVSTNGSDYQRHVFADVAENQFGARPLIGIGLSVDNDAQNIYLQLLAAGGVLLMGAFVMLLGGVAQSVGRARGGPLHEDAVAIGLSVFGWVINGYYDAQLADKYLYVLPGILIACARWRSLPGDDGTQPTRSTGGGIPPDAAPSGPVQRVAEVFGVA